MIKEVPDPNMPDAVKSLLEKSRIEKLKPNTDYIVYVGTEDYHPSQAQLEAMLEVLAPVAQNANCRFMIMNDNAGIKFKIFHPSTVIKRTIAVWKFFFSRKK